MNKIKRFFNKYAISNLMQYIIVGNIIVFILDNLLYKTVSFDLVGWLNLNPIDLFHGQVWRLFTFILVLPELGTGLTQIIIWNIINLYFYYLIGTNLERYYGTARFNMIYASGVLCCWVFCVLGYVVNWFAPSFFIMTSMSASIVNLGLFLCFATLFPEHQFTIFFIIPIKVKWLGIIDFIMLVRQILNIFLFGDLLVGLTALAVLANYFIWFGNYWAERGWLFGKRKTRQAKYKSKLVKIKSKDIIKNYRHKCCVCGKTDESDPKMQFRYCVQCSGLKEYCMDHINDHTHE